MFRLLYIFAFVSFLLINLSGLANPLMAGDTVDASTVVVPESTNNTPEDISYKKAGVVSLTSSRDFWLSCVIVGFGILIIVIEFLLLRPVVQQKTEEIAKTYIVTLIIIGTLVLISAGYTSEQIAPALGLFGTIAGYLLGKQSMENLKKDLS